MKKHAGFIFTILTLVALGMAGLSQAANPSVGLNESSVQFTAAITAGTTATVCSAVTSRAHNVRAVVITNTASGFVRFYSDTNAVGANLIGTFGVIANTPLVVTEDVLGPGIVTTVGKALVVDATTGTVSLQLRDRLDKVSPR
jgi:hypothetical protein